MKKHKHYFDHPAACIDPHPRTIGLLHSHIYKASHDKRLMCTQVELDTYKCVNKTCVKKIVLNKCPPLKSLWKHRWSCLLPLKPHSSSCRHLQTTSETSCYNQIYFAEPQRGIISQSHMLTVSAAVKLVKHRPPLKETSPLFLALQISSLLPEHLSSQFLPCK